MSEAQFKELIHWIKVLICCLEAPMTPDQSEAVQKQIREFQQLERKRNRLEFINNRMEINPKWYGGNYQIHQDADLLLLDSKHGSFFESTQLLLEQES